MQSRAARLHPVWIWLGAWVAALLVDYPLAAWLLATPKSGWGGLRAALVAAAHLLGQGYVIVLLGLALGGLGWWLSRRPWQLVWRWFVGSVLVTGFWAQGLKHLVGRPRPRQWGQYGVWLPCGPTFRPSWDSFPSGHAMTVFAAAPLLAALFPRLGRGWYVLATAIAAGRVLGADHFLSDTVAGAGLGLAIGYYVRDRWQAEVEHAV